MLIMYFNKMVPKNLSKLFQEKISVEFKIYFKNMKCQTIRNVNLKTREYVKSGNTKFPNFIIIKYGKPSF